ncbi:flagellar hook-length control protein FliK [Sodalis sp. RH19]|uniref:flagellar hook-length control protein FliK n=1 Tax=Sodalis sp. RH19 TaxID=3394334 RepID=UPI0039B4E218
MIVAVSDIASMQDTAGGNGAKNTGNAAPDFSAMLSGKVNDRQRPAPAADAGSAQADAAEDAPVATTAEPARPDLLAEKLAAKLTGDVPAGAVNETLPPSAGDTATAPAAMPAATAQEADPVLTSDAAALMALLALTRPTVADTSVAAAGVTANTDSAAAALSAAAAQNSDMAVATVPLAQAENAAALSVGTNNAAATADNAQNTVITPDDAAATPPLTSPAALVAGFVSAKTVDATAPELKTVSAATATKGKPSPVADAGLPPPAATAATGSPVNPAIAAGTDSANEGTDPAAVTALLLKKTTGVLSDVSMPGATAPVTPTLSAADAAVTTPAAPAPALISAQLGSDEWRQAIGQQVLMQLRNGQQNAELRLHPDNLGALQISLRMDGNNQAQIHLASGHSQVRSALEDALPQLRASLAESGIHLGQSSVGSDATPNWGGAGQEAAGNARAASGFTIDAVAGNASGVVAPATTGRRAAGIDTFA